MAYTDLKLAELHTLLYGGPLEDDYESGRLSSPEFVRRVRTLCRLSCSEDDIAHAWGDIFSPNEVICAWCRD